MIIGNFTYNKAKDVYSGEIRTLTLSRNKVAFRPLDAKGEKAPSYRIVFEGAAGSTEAGAAWKRTSEQGREFLSVSIDDPALSHALSAALMPSDDGASAILIWSRLTKRETPAS